MSLIHCSPLFHPLEPLPVMGPAATRSAEKVHFSSSSKKSGAGGTGKPTASSKKGKKAAVLRNQMLSPASTALNTPVSANSPYSMRQPLNISLTSGNETGHSSTHMLEHGMMQQAYEENLFDSHDQGSLTFTTESQPMEDLSSSQQIRERNN